MMPLGCSLQGTTCVGFGHRQGSAVLRAETEVRAADRISAWYVNLNM